MLDVSITTSLQQKLQAMPTGADSAGLLIGLADGDQVKILDMTLTFKEINLVTPHAAGCMLPHGLSFVGVWGTSSAAAQQVAKSQLPPTSPSPAVTVLACLDDNGACGYQTLAGASITPVVIDTAEDRLGCIWSSHTPVRASVALELQYYLPASNGDAAKPQALFCALNLLTEQLAAPGVIYLAAGSAATTVVSTSSSGCVHDLAAKLSPGTPICLSPLLSTSPSSNGSPSATPTTTSAASAPVFQYRTASASSGGTTGKGQYSMEVCMLLLDVLVYAPKQLPLSQLAEKVILPAWSSQLEACKAVILSQAAVSQVAAYHFLPAGRDHHVTLLYPNLTSEINEAKLAPLRRELHTLLGLPDNRPSLRASNALAALPSSSSAPPEVAAGVSAQTRLKDVHVGLGLPAIGGTVSMVDGSYDYHHYMQDRFNDAGWGCAYRSLQTICSWFRLQQYSRRASPSHREIQETLVRLGDKPANFVGSSNWIGAIELSYVLDDLLGVSCRIMTINKGSEIPSRARELAAHFQSQGTPIMIGGGVLAYTLLGVQFNESTGDCAFLILDPHYTGGEDIKKIHQGTWVAWKRPGDSAAAGGPLFVQDAFYNFLCPIRPKEV